MKDEYKQKGGGVSMIGDVYGVNWPGAEEHAAQVTTWEIEQLCKIWAEKRRVSMFDYDAFGQTSRADCHRIALAEQRLSYFAGLIGEDKVEEILAGVFANYEAEAQAAHQACEALLEEEQAQAARANVATSG